MAATHIQGTEGNLVPLNMKRSYELTKEKIDEKVTRTSPGNYALGHIYDNKFQVRYVGRSDDDLNVRLKKHVGGKYKRFKYSYASSPKAAFEKECRNYHEFKSVIDNTVHPDRPDGTSRKCPVCGM